VLAHNLEHARSIVKEAVRCTNREAEQHTRDKTVEGARLSALQIRIRWRQERSVGTRLGVMIASLLLSISTYVAGKNAATDEARLVHVLVFELFGIVMYWSFVALLIRLFAPTRGRR